MLTPLVTDHTSLIAVSQLLLRPGLAQALAASAMRDYAVPPGAVDLVRV